MRRIILPYNPHLKERARQLRQQMTRTEVILWQHLQRKQLYGYDFDRQRPLDEYIVDFFCKDSNNSPPPLIVTTMPFG